jgi:hypothetical protein
MRKEDAENGQRALRKSPVSSSDLLERRGKGSEFKIQSEDLSFPI